MAVVSRGFAGSTKIGYSRLVIMESMMSFTDEQLEKAMLVTLEFGPRRRLSRESRLLEIEPHLAPEMVKELFAFCDTVQSAAYNLGGDVLNNKMDSEIAQQKLSAQFPLLSQKVVSLAISQGAYFSMK